MHNFRQTLSLLKISGLALATQLRYTLRKRMLLAFSIMNYHLRRLARATVLAAILMTVIAGQALGESTSNAVSVFMSLLPAIAR